MKGYAVLLGALAMTSQAADQSLVSEAIQRFTLGRENAVVVRNLHGRAVLRYELERPADSQLTVESACYFHPLTTPRGVALTDVAPSDHRHHRGIFLAWVEMHGRKEADFWGWGEHAPKQDRRIVNRSYVPLTTVSNQAAFQVNNEWLAEGEPLMKERLRVSFWAEPSAHVLDLTFSLTADSDLSLARWAFSGFCVRARKDGQLTVEGPQGAVTLPNPSHTKPESDWPPELWYDYTLRLSDGTVAGVAVLDHPKNPAALWHNVRDIRMLNPCIVAPGEIKLKAGAPLVLRYRVVAHDGPVPRALLNKLAKDWSVGEAL